MSTLRLPAKEYSALCKSILQRDGYKCCSCGMRSGLHIHHIIFRSQQGPDEACNLITLCSSCHEAVHRSDLKITEEKKFIRRNGWQPS
jgi:5-methylcytosine-specific restriction endonuclease McrA